MISDCKLSDICFATPLLLPLLENTNTELKKVVNTLKRSLIMISDCEFVALFYYFIIINYNKKLSMNIVSMMTSIKIKKQTIQVVIVW